MLYAGVTVAAGFKEGRVIPIYFVIDTDPVKRVFDVVDVINFHETHRDSCIVMRYVCRLKEPDIEVTMNFYAHKNDGIWWSIDSHEKQLV